MKIYKIADVTDLKKPIDINDFASRDKYEHTTSLVVKFDERFSVKKNMPAEAKQMVENEHMSHQKKKLIDMTYNDMELVRLAFHHAVNNAVVRELERKYDKSLETKRKHDLDTILSEIGGQKFRIFMEWIKRFHMQKLFHDIKIKSYDDFKAMEHYFHTHTDKNQKVQLEQFLRQFGLDPRRFPPPMKYAQLTGQDRIILRDKAEDERVKLIDLSDVRLKMAQLQAASSIAHNEAVHRALNEWVQKLYSGPTETEKKLQAIKK